MPNEDKDRKLTTDELVHVGLAVKDPIGYLVGTIVLELVKLPFTITWALIKEVRGSAERKKLAEIAAKEKAKNTERAREAAEKEREQRILERERDREARKQAEADRAVLDGFLKKEPKPELEIALGEEVKKIISDPDLKEYFMGSHIFMRELIRFPEVRKIVSARGVSAEVLEEKLEELKEQHKVLHGGQSRISPIVRKVIAVAGKGSKARFLKEHGDVGGKSEITVSDLFESAINTDDFLAELAPVWAPLRTKSKNDDS